MKGDKYIQNLHLSICNYVAKHFFTSLQVSPRDPLILPIGCYCIPLEYGSFVFYCISTNVYWPFPTAMPLY